MMNLMVYQSGTYRVHELVRDVTMIGRAPSNHIVIDNPVVSAQHAIVLKVGDFYRLKDLNSTNGTHWFRQSGFCSILSQSVAKAVPWNAADVAVMVGVDVISAVGVYPKKLCNKLRGPGIKRGLT
jgi:hypothetical protein